jgi:hypothetical protein
VLPISGPAVGSPSAAGKCYTFMMSAQYPEWAKSLSIFQSGSPQIRPRHQSKNRERARVQILIRRSPLPMRCVQPFDAARQRRLLWVKRDPMRFVPASHDVGNNLKADVLERALIGSINESVAPLPKSR